MSKSIILTRKERCPERDVLVHADGIVERDVDVQESGQFRTLIRSQTLLFYLFILPAKSRNEINECNTVA